MGLFGSKKPTEFDEMQDKQLKQLMANQKILIENNAYFLETIRKLWTWPPNLDKRMKALEAETVKNRERDEALAARFKSLGSVMVNEEETT